MTARLDTVLQHLNDGQGTAGQLLHDKQLYENMNQTVTEMTRAGRRDQEGPEEIPEREGQHFLTEQTCPRTDNSGSVMMAFVVGALTGAAVALLFAPASGEETREYLGQKAREGKDKAREAMDRAANTTAQREHLITAVERGREAFQQARERGEQA